MHYNDKEAIEKSKLVIVVYKHGTSKKNKFDYQISSIKRCEYINPFRLLRIFRKTNKYFKDVLKNEIEEHYYEIEITILDGYTKFSIDYIKDVSDTPNDIDQLH